MAILLDEPGEVGVSSSPIRWLFSVVIMERFFQWGFNFLEFNS
jgi:hypothetical protein